MHTRKLRKQKKILAVVLPVLVTIALWILSKFRRDIEFELSIEIILQYTSQVFALAGIVLLSITFLMTTRLRIIENLFGGLDKMYQLHRDVSKTAFLLILIHPILLWIINIDDFEVLRTLTFMPDTVAKLFGILSLVLFSALILITVLKKVPYQIWKNIHKLMGIPFLFGAIHGVLAESDIREDALLRDWIVLWIFIGLISYIYKLLLYRRIGPKYTYKVKSSKQLTDDIYEIVFLPVKAKMSFEPGEFVFLSFLDHEWINSELHPFSISSGPSKNSLRITYKVVGDYTKSLKYAQEDDLVNIYGAYGEFTSYIFNSYKKQIWIAGGIGVTPFISMLEYESHNEDKKDITFFYCTKEPEQEIYYDEIKEIIKDADDNINLECVYSKTHGRLTAKSMKEKIPDIDEYLILMCGSQKMMQSIEKQLIKLGISPDMIVYEEFNLK